MSFSKLSRGIWIVALAATMSCDQNGQVGGRTPPGAAPAANNNGGDALYRRLGGADGIRTVMTDFANRAVADPAINAYFLNEGVQAARIIECLVLQVSSLTGAGVAYPGNSGCRDMRTTHANMNISSRDFDETAAHLVAALQKYNVAQADIQTIIGAVATTKNDIVADVNNNGTLYSRLGRRQGIDGAVVAFMQTLFADGRISAFFGGATPQQADHIRTCLGRMICEAAAGPCKYGREVDGEPGVGANNKCKGMLESHQNIRTPRQITYADFQAVVEDLVRVLDSARVAEADKMAILNALGPTCRQIVAGGVGCP
jgi:hemoglobin